MKKSNMLFILTMIMGTMITVSSNNWMSMWMGLELNMMSFIPLIKNENKMSSEASMIYFLTQSVSSMLLLFSVIGCAGGKEMQLFISLGCVSLLIKLGSAPFHMWFPEIMSKMKWNSCILLMTWQKLAPLTMINNMSNNNKIMYIAVILSTMVGAIGGLNQTSLRKIMSYSSINHLGWMLSINKIQNNWMIYWMIYSALTTTMCMMFNNFNMSFINQINSMKMSSTEKITCSISMLSMGGLPPFTGFLPKWMVIQILIYDNMYTLITVMVMTSLITLFYYMRTMTSMMIMYSNTSLSSTMKSNNKLNFMMLTLNLSLPLIVVLNL
uniref:NADH dehydrogenase subunit 2 n=1 Tax=Macroscytus subaeneus TaxID=498949 RepID=UPI001D112609|nr:NADH dehydrogenase subunit 2 [Macroscytus subaeneus]UCC46026.1 NADH dehydrogenase subunit 2 [Macroscytus subaeneus]